MGQSFNGGEGSVIEAAASTAPALAARALPLPPTRLIETEVKPAPPRPGWREGYEGSGRWWSSRVYEQRALYASIRKASRQRARWLASSPVEDKACRLANRARPRTSGRSCHGRACGEAEAEIMRECGQQHVLAPKEGEGSRPSIQARR